MPVSTGKLTSFSTRYERDVAHRAILEEREAERAKQRRFQDTLEKITLHRARGMSERQLVLIYGQEAVQMERESVAATNGMKESAANASNASSAAIIALTPSLSSVQARLPARRAAN